MNISELFTIIYPFIKCKCKNRAGFYDFVLTGCVSRKFLKLRLAIRRKSSRQKENIVRGRSSLHNVASSVSFAFDCTDFCSFLDKVLSEEAKEVIIEKLKNEAPEINKINFAESVGKILKDIIDSSAERNVQRKKKDQSGLCVLNPHDLTQTRQDLCFFWEK